MFLQLYSQHQEMSKSIIESIGPHVDFIDLIVNLQNRYGKK
jgi:hypothetical protein